VSAARALVEVPLELTTPAHHGAILHGGRRGHVAIARATPAGWQEKAYPVRDLADVLPVLAGESDVYISTNRFWGWRRISRLAELGALALDVDFHKVADLAGSHPLGILEDCTIALERSQLPAPSIAIASGRGLYLIWLHEPIPRSAIERWNACQRELWQALKPFGADRGALDAARVLRPVGTRNSKARLTVEALTAPGEVWTFDDLATEILPLDRGELADLRIQRAARRPQERPQRTPEGYTAGTLWESRLSDLQTLRRLRWFGDLPEHHRDLWLFIAGVGMSWVAIPQVLRRELFALAHEAASWPGRESKARMQAVMKRATMAARGETVEWNGLQVDARYRFKNQTIIEWLEITPEEEREMLTIVSNDERRRRKREAKTAARRREGMVPREEYLNNAAARRQEAFRLRSKGLSQARIAKRLGVAQQTVSTMLRGGY
jgi:hypothetical protein